MLKLRYSNKFKRDYKAVQKQRHDITELQNVIKILCNQSPLPERMHDHALTGEWKGYRECHIRPDWLFIYKIDNENLILTAARTGSHSELFG